MKKLKCPICEGRGGIGDCICSNCDGEGKISKNGDEKIELFIYDLKTEIQQYAKDGGPLVPEICSDIIKLVNQTYKNHKKY